MFPPRLIIIGAQKAGTTSLAAALARHPDVVLGNKKEPDYYTGAWDRGLDWYRDNYPDTGATWLIDASTSYSAAFVDPALESVFPVAERIGETVTDPRFLYILRDPVDRAYSAYWHARRFGVEKRSLREALSPSSTYIRQGCYVEHLEYYYRHFDRSSIRVIDFDDFKRDETLVLEALAQFLSIDPTRFVEPADNAVKNRSFEYSRLAQIGMRVFGSRERFQSVVSTVKKSTPQSVSNFGSLLLTRKIPPLSSGDREWLSPIFEPYTRRLESLLGRSFDRWTRPSDVAEPADAGASFYD